ncbi:Coenzyme A biosynthesis protein 3 [Ceratocystis fimbriata CBS 114723]|uniref:Coenzyme A biosynthesis protein 3 n=1 Tax=Ceratocystis fimbriata CBS 114723 TaxID=1035309 RepID=A0A2C5X2H9_9PEZI|nr:Coenzyme A biosynthesis protein 3 [Ceratocystis fimbriata CBS 114723]
MVHDPALSGEHPADDLTQAVNDGKAHLIIACSGSVATIKLPLILAALGKYEKLSIRVVMTNASRHFLSGQAEEQPTLHQVRAMRNVDAIYGDEDEWVVPWSRGKAILHIELRRWAHLMLIAPLSLNTLAKLANGLSDNLLTSIVRAWDQAKIILVAPAGNTAMWNHPVTARQLTILEEWPWFEIYRPQEGVLACGDAGDGKMKEWSELVEIVEMRLGLGPWGNAW